MPVRGNPRGYGGVAQLGEHLPCKQGVKGSNPFISTTNGETLMGSKLSWLERAPDKREVGSSNLLEPTKANECQRKDISEKYLLVGIHKIPKKRTLKSE